MAQPLRTLCREFPGLRPRLQVLPSPALLRLLEEGELDAALSFRLESEGRARYRALCSVPLYCLFPSPADLPAAAALAPADLQPYPLVVMEPRRGGALSPLAAELAAGRSVRRLYFAASPEEALTLTDAGLGATVLPALFIPPQQMDRCVPLSGVPAASFGVYTRPEDADAPLRRLLALLAQLDWMTDRTPAAAAE